MYSRLLLVLSFLVVVVVANGKEPRTPCHKTSPCVLCVCVCVFVCMLVCSVVDRVHVFPPYSSFGGVDQFFVDFE